MSGPGRGSKVAGYQLYPYSRRDDRTQTSAFLSLALWILSCYTSTRDVWYHFRSHPKNKLYATYALNGGNNHLTTTTPQLFPVMWDPVVSTALLCNRILCYSCPWVLLTRNKLSLCCVCETCYEQTSFEPKWQMIWDSRLPVNMKAQSSYWCL